MIPKPDKLRADRIGNYFATRPDLSCAAAAHQFRVGLPRRVARI